MISTKQSNQFWILKALAIFTVCFAHFTPHYDGLSTIFHNIGMWGVPTFLIVAGYFDYTSKFSIKKNLKGLIVPLVIWGFVTYWVIPFLMWTISHFLFSGHAAIPEFSFWGLFKWIVGSGTWLYFVTVLFECKILCRIPYSRYVLLVMGLTSMILTRMNVVVTPPQLFGLVFTKYMNPLNYIVYFLIGRWIREHTGDRDIDVSKHKTLLLVSSLFLILLIGNWAKSASEIGGLFLGCSAALFLYVISSFLRPQKTFVNIGKHSFVIYFLHMPIGALLFYNLPFLAGTPFEWINVIIAFSFVCLIIQLMYYILSKLKWNKLSSMLGFR